MSDDYEEYSNKFDNVDKELTIKFASKEASLYFKDWLCESGEQQYWNWMEGVEKEYNGDITAVEFNYHTGDSTITTECSRLDKPLTED